MDYHCRVQITGKYRPLDESDEYWPVSVRQKIEEALRKGYTPKIKYNADTRIITVTGTKERLFLKTKALHK